MPPSTVDADGIKAHFPHKWGQIRSSEVAMRPHLLPACGGSGPVGDEGGLLTYATVIHFWRIRPVVMARHLLSK